jgi:hypothetical protein
MKMDDDDDLDLTGKAPESWYCVDCGVNTAPGVPNRIELEKAMKTAIAVGKLTGKDEGVPTKITNQCEIYTNHSLRTANDLKSNIQFEMLTDRTSLT